MLEDADENCPSFQPASPGEIVAEVTMMNKKGLHARASAKFVQCVEKFNADIKVTRCGETVGGLSIMGLMMLNAAYQTNVHLSATGEQAQEAIHALVELINNRFGEPE